MMLRNLLLFLFSILSYCSLKAQLKPGDVSPTAKMLDADKLKPFSYGVAVIAKGKFTALIDTNGNLVVPYDTWYFTDNATSGMFLVDPTRLQHGYTLINTEGRVLIPPQSRDNRKASVSLSQYGYALVNDGTQIFHLNAKGEQFPFDPGPPTRSVLELHEDMGRFVELKDGKRKFGFVDRNGKVVAPAQYDFAADFSEGLALVGKQEPSMQYGYINKKGKMVIALPYMHGEPQSFSSGLAGVYPAPKDADKFSYAYIDKEGKMVIKIDKGLQGDRLDLFLQGPSVPAFSNGYAIWRGREPVVFDTTGQMMSIAQVLQMIGVNAADLDSLYPIGGITKDFIWLNGKNRKQGLYNRKTHTIWPPIFEHFEWNASDPASKLIHARLQVVENGRRKMREGYVNEDGVFVLLIPDENMD